MTINLEREERETEEYAIGLNVGTLVILREEKNGKDWCIVSRKAFNKSPREIKYREKPGERVF